MAGLIRGTQGWVYYGGKKILRMNNWTVNPVVGIDDVTDFGSSGVEREYSGVADITGSLSGFYEPYDTSTGGTKSPMLSIVRGFMHSTGTAGPVEGLAKFIESSKSMYFGTILFTDIGKNQPSQGNQTITLNWGCNGKFTWKNSTST